ncbi:expressed unknown protein [Seminavis robusta]|uniref:Uncharacterized protein n=1 Tax=Seminavis robusta TaxID=568900 RepID=A0A9N8DN77_9STRA|nr:expressed unknown protein [Seminavis robusta]|eukprot:Sro254_g100250.1 n/a (184) ;mRNA; f:82488-83039
MSNPLAAFFSVLAIPHDATFVDDNAAGHERKRRRISRRERNQRRSLSGENRTQSRWETNESQESIESPTTMSKSLRRPKRTSSDENNRRFEKSQRVMPLRKPMRQATPDINYDVERALLAKKGHKALRKPMRQLTPPPPPSTPSLTSWKISPPLRRVSSSSSSGSSNTAMTPQKCQLVRQGSC